MDTMLPEICGWKVSVGVSCGCCLIVTGDCCINSGISAATAAELWPGQDDDEDDDDDIAAAAAGAGLDWFNHADVDDVSVGCDSWRSSGWGCVTVWAPKYTVKTHTAETPAEHRQLNTVLQ